MGWFGLVWTNIVILMLSIWSFTFGEVGREGKSSFPWEKNYGSVHSPHPIVFDIIDFPT